MTQATQVHYAIDELLLAGTLSGDEFAAFVRAYRVPPNSPTLMLLEEQPHHVVKEQERQDLLCFALFDRAFDFTPYTSGRIFHELGELHWERQQANVYIVYTGHKAYQPNLQKATTPSALDTFALDTYTPNDRGYFLFGKRLNQKQVPSAQAGDFAEVRIPRFLRYPVLPHLAPADRIRLVVCEYSDPITGLNVAYRFKCLQPS